MQCEPPKSCSLAMIMDNFTARRTATTYGKSAKRPLVHDFFEHRNNHTNVSTTTSSQLPALYQRSQDTPSELQLVKDTTIAHKHAPRESSGLSSRSTSQSPEPAAARDSLQDGNVFDIGSSDEEKAGNEFGTRRRTVQPVRSSNAVTSEHSTRLAPRSANVPHGVARSTKTISGAMPKRGVELEQTKHNGEQKPKDAELKPPPPVRHKDKRQPKPREPTNIQKKAAKTRATQRPQARTKIEASTYAEDVSEEFSDLHTDYSSHSVASVSGTPKRVRLSTPCDELHAPSPSQLGMTLLHLASRDDLSPRSVASSESMSSRDNDKTPRRTRVRLVDRLDAPDPVQESQSNGEQQQLDGHEENAQDIGHKQPQGTSRLKKDGKVRSSEPLSAPVADQALNTQNRSTYATKSRTTYARERSHLSDMNDNLEALSAMSSQQSSRNTLLHSSVSNLALQLEMEDDESDSQSGIGKLKSIHELRQAGATNRYDREMQALLEDIESIRLVARSQQLMALTKLLKRLGDAAFLRVAGSTGYLKRLLQCASYDMDPLSSILLVMILRTLSQVDGSSNVLQQLYRAVVQIAPKVLYINTSLSEVLENQKQTLPKTALRDLANLEQHVLETGLLAGYHYDQIYPSLLVVMTLDEALRGTLRVGLSHGHNSSGIYERLLTLLEAHADRLTSERERPEGMAIIERTLSLLEACSMAFDTVDPKIGKQQYSVLGNSLSTFMRTAADDQIVIEQSVLRVIVSLSNKKPEICHLFGQTPVLGTVFAVISTNFTVIAERAELEQTLDQPKLDSVILALGCLLNFAECDDKMRLKLASHTAISGDCLDQLVSIFNSQVSKTQDATTPEQSQVLVAFGYLSMLLCTLSLNVLVRARITQLLEDKSFTVVCDAAETFFSHLRTLETISDDDASMSAFTARFNAILDTVRNSVS